MNDSDDFRELIFLTKIRDKAYKTKQMYNPNLISNLSKEAYDLYLIRMSICDQLLEELDKEGITVEQIKDFVKNKVNKIRERLNKAKNEIETKFIQLSIKEWENIL
ncbi:MAG: hypothetical protein ACFFHD_07495 [Promethearchaeota archaeon]